jgi:hypothetical protein
MKEKLYHKHFERIIKMKMKKKHQTNKQTKEKRKKTKPMENALAGKTKCLAKLK